MELKLRIEIENGLRSVGIGLVIGSIFLSLIMLYPLQSSSIVPISNILATGTLAFIGLQQALFLSREQTVRRYQQEIALEKVIERVKELKKKGGLSNELYELYDNAEKRWTRDILRPLEFSHVVYLFLIALILFVLTSIVSSSDISKDIVLLEMRFPQLLIWNSIRVTFPQFLFAVSLSSLTILLATHMGIIRQLERITLPRRGHGEIWINKINELDFPNQEREITYHLKNEERLLVDVCFKGNISNGFFDTLVKFSDGYSVWCPDRQTYLCDFGYHLPPEEPMLVLLVSDEVGLIEGGVISGKRDYENTRLTLTFPLVHNESNRDLGFVVSGSRKIKQLQIGIFEDPILLPTEKPRGGGMVQRDPVEIRYPIDKVTINLVEGSLGVSDKIQELARALYPDS